MRARDQTLATKILKPPRKLKGTMIDDETMEESEESEDDDYAYQELMEAEFDVQVETQADGLEMEEESISVDEYIRNQSDNDDLPVPPSGQVPNSAWSQASPHKASIPDSEWSNVEVVA